MTCRNQNYHLLLLINVPNPFGETTNLLLLINEFTRGSVLSAGVNGLQ